MRGALAALVLLFLAVSAVAQDFYADFAVDVGESGQSVVSGTANHPLLSARATDSFTSKRGSYWLFNLTLPANDTFSDFVYDIRLPQGAQVSYVKSLGQFRISSEGGRVSVSGVGADEPVAILIQYQIGGKVQAPLEPIVQEDNSIYYIVAVVAVLVVVVSVFVLRRKSDDEVISYDPGMLTDRQNDILRAVRDAGRPVNQTVVCERLNLAKSSVSRNVDSLVKMGLLTKTRNGMSTMLSAPKE
jgi:uncharacterized membrane protein